MIDYDHVIPACLISTGGILLYSYIICSRGSGSTIYTINPILPILFLLWIDLGVNKKREKRIYDSFGLQLNKNYANCISRFLLSCLLASFSFTCNLIGPDVIILYKSCSEQ